MSDTRFRVFIGLVPSFNSTVAIQFGEDHEGRELANLYRELIRQSATKRLLKWEGDTVIIALPEAAKNVEVSGSNKSFVVHFDTPASAEDWSDEICRLVEDYPKQVLIKQVWKPRELEELKDELRKHISHVRFGPPVPVFETQPPPRHAGDVPGQSERSDGGARLAQHYVGIFGDEPKVVAARAGPLPGQAHGSRSARP